MARLRAKFKCDSITEYSTNKTAELSAVITGSEENKSFSKFTPNGRLSISIDSDVDASNFFEVTKEYFIDFQRADI